MHCLPVLNKAKNKKHPQGSETLGVLYLGINTLEVVFLAEVCDGVFSKSNHHKYEINNSDDFNLPMGKTGEHHHQYQAYEQNSGAYLSGD